MMTAILVVASDVVFAAIEELSIVPTMRFDKVGMGEIALAKVVVSAAMRLVEGCGRVDVTV
jgi:hypothetical protein